MHAPPNPEQIKAQADQMKAEAEIQRVQHNLAQGHAATNHGIQITQQANAVKAVTVQSTLEDFDPILGRLETLVVRAGQAADRIVGPRPSPVAPNEKDPAPNNLIYSLQTRRKRLMEAVDRLENEMQRIEGNL